MELYLSSCSKAAKAASTKTAASSLAEEVRAGPGSWSLVGGAGRAPTGPTGNRALGAPSRGSASAATGWWGTPGPLGCLQGEPFNPGCVALRSFGYGRGLVCLLHLKKAVKRSQARGPSLLRLRPLGPPHSTLELCNSGALETGALAISGPIRTRDEEGRCPATMELYLNFCSKRAKAASVKTAASSLAEEVRAGQGPGLWWAGRGEPPAAPRGNQGPGGAQHRSPGCPSTLTSSLLASFGGSGSGQASPTESKPRRKANAPHRP
ncbi:hypothetical protein QTO34_002485 [Cnephaeus nilssonii]|uniref:Uncharacterized protein n=1 Tax=Cnephaeus nilssonii TaxID=3371016 RepID=A0AA40HT00_CNENI|nr:hypothetical protein QTO34_002485 [Eptesicus nilssonii]